MKQSKKLNKLDIVLIVLACFVVIFTAVMVVTFWKFQEVPDTLITCLLGSSTVELAATTCIKIFGSQKSKDNVEN